MELTIKVEKLENLSSLIDNEFVELPKIDIEIDLNHITKSEFETILLILNHIEMNSNGEYEYNNTLQTKVEKDSNSLDEIKILYSNTPITVNEFLRVYYKTNEINRNHVVGFNKWLVNEGYQEKYQTGYKILDNELGIQVGSIIKWDYRLLKAAVQDANLILSQLGRYGDLYNE